MGSYLEIDGKETNCKAYSRILIDAIRELDKRAQAKPYIKEIQKYFIAEEYKEDGTGIGNYSIRRKGMALLVIYLNELIYDKEEIVEIAKTEHEYALQHCEKEEYDELLNEFIEMTESEILWCTRYASDILAEMVLQKRKRVEAKWV